MEVKLETMCTLMDILCAIYLDAHKIRSPNKAQITLAETYARDKAINILDEWENYTCEKWSVVG